MVCIGVIRTPAKSSPKLAILVQVKQDIIYLDHAAATPLDERVLAAMQPYFSDAFFNPSSPYQPAVEVRHAYEAAKASVARQLGVRPEELVMTAGATESINLAFHQTGGHVIVSAIEHPAVLAAASQRDVTVVAVDAHGRIDMDALQKAIRPETEFISIGLANSEIGTIQPLGEIAQLVQMERENRQQAGNQTPLYLHSDASQGVGQLDVQIARLGVDLLTLNAAKLYGPKQVGLLYMSRQLSARPQVVGGGQENGLRSGTENVAGVIGFAKALELVVVGRKTEVTRLAALRDDFERSLIAVFPEAVLSGYPKHRLAGHLHISFPGIDAERLIFALESQNVLVATGSACAANKGTRSHVLEAIGLPPDVADGSLRITLGHLSDEANCKIAIEAIIDAVNREKARLG